MSAVRSQYRRRSVTFDGPADVLLISPVASLGKCAMHLGGVAM